MVVKLTNQDVLKAGAFTASALHLMNDMLNQGINLYPFSALGYNRLRVVVSMIEKGINPFAYAYPEIYEDSNVVRPSTYKLESDPHYNGDLSGALYDDGAMCPRLREYHGLILKRQYTISNKNKKKYNTWLLDYIEYKDYVSNDDIVDGKFTPKATMFTIGHVPLTFYYKDGTEGNVDLPCLMFLLSPAMRNRLVVGGKLNEAIQETLDETKLSSFLLIRDGVIMCTPMPHLELTKGAIKRVKR